MSATLIIFITMDSTDMLSVTRDGCQIDAGPYKRPLYSTDLIFTAKGSLPELISFIADRAFQP